MCEILILFIPPHFGNQLQIRKFAHFLLQSIFSPHSPFGAPYQQSEIMWLHPVASFKEEKTFALSRYLWELSIPVNDFLWFHSLSRLLALRNNNLFSAEYFSPTKTMKKSHFGGLLGALLEDQILQCPCGKGVFAVQLIAFCMGSNQTSPSCKQKHHHAEVPKPFSSFNCNL